MIDFMEDLYVSLEISSVLVDNKHFIFNKYTQENNKQQCIEIRRVVDFNQRKIIDNAYMIIIYFPITDTFNIESFTNYKLKHVIRNSKVNQIRITKQMNSFLSKMELAQ